MNTGVSLGLGTLTELEAFVEKNGLKKLQDYIMMRYESMKSQEMASNGSQIVG